MKYLNRFKTKEEYTTEFVKEQYNVVFIDDIKELLYNIDSPINYRKIKLILKDIPEGEEPNISVAPLKYNKKFAFNYSIDDNSMQAYSVVERLFQGKYIDDEEFFHLNAPFEYTTGVTPDRMLTYTDGCGKKKFFTTSNYLIQSFVNDRNNTGKSNPYLTLDEIKYLQDFDSTWGLHNVVDESINPSELAKQLTAFNNVMESYGLGRSIISSTPDNKLEYMEAANLCPDIKSYIGKLITKQDTLLIDTKNKFKIPRAFLSVQSDAGTYDLVRSAAESSKLGSEAYWITIGTHRPRAKSDFTSWNYLKDFFTWICKTYGSEGDDSVWFVSDREIVEYLITKNLITIDKNKVENDWEVIVNFPELPNFLYNGSTTILVDKVANVANNEIKGLSWTKSSTETMINIDDRESLIDVAERYLSKFENDYTKDNYIDATYSIEKLNVAVATKFLERLKVLTSAPIISSLSCPAQIEDPEIHITGTFTGKAIKYMASTNQSFLGAEWEPLNSNNGEFEINVPIPRKGGNYTLYFKLGNFSSESEVLEKEIVYVPKPFDLVNITVENEKTFTGATKITFKTQGEELPTQYMLGEDPTLESSSWQDYKDTVDYTFTGDYGVKTLYAKVKTGNIESSIKSTTVEWERKKIVIARATAYNDPDVGFNPKTGINTINIVSAGTPVNYNTGESAATIKIADAQSTNNIVAPTSGAIYPEYLYSRAWVWRYITTEDKHPKMTIEIPDGTYTIKILNYLNAGYNKFTDAQNLENSTYAVNDVVKAPTVSPVGNVSTHTVFENVSPINGKITINIEGALDHMTVPVNFIEVIPN